MKIQLTRRVIFDHVLFAARFALLHLDEGYVESVVSVVHVVRAELVAQRTRQQPFRARTQR